MRLSTKDLDELQNELEGIDRCLIPVLILLEQGGMDASPELEQRLRPLHNKVRKILGKSPLYRPLLKCGSEAA